MMFGCVAPAIVTQPKILQDIPISSVSSILESVKPHTPTPIPAPSPTISTSVANPIRKRHIQIIIRSIGDEDWDKNVRQAILEWNQALGFEVFKETKSFVRIVVTYENRAMETNLTAVGAYYKNNCKGPKITLFKYLKKSSRKTAILHELGHALGLSHSEERLDIMYASISPSRKLSDNDIKRVDVEKINCL